MAFLKPGTPFIRNIAGKAGSGIYRKTLPGPGVSDSVEENLLVPGRQRRPGKKSKCNCKAFGLCDHLYTAMPEVQKQVWRDCVKKRGRTGYTVWMSECLHLMQQGLYGPDVPSESGGFSPSLAVPGVNYPPPEECVEVPPVPPFPAHYYSVVIERPNIPAPAWIALLLASGYTTPPLATYARMDCYWPPAPWVPAADNHALRLRLEAGGVSREGAFYGGITGLGPGEAYAQKFNMTVSPAPETISISWLIDSITSAVDIPILSTRLYSIPVNGLPDDPAAVLMDSVDIGPILKGVATWYKATFHNNA